MSRRFGFRSGRARLMALAFVCAAGLLRASGGQAAQESAERAYADVRKDVSAFRKDAQKRRFRHHYQHLIQRLDKVAKDHPGAARADDAAFVAAQLYAEMYQISLLREDALAAAEGFEALAARHPKSNLADDALFEAASLRDKPLGDLRKARGNLERLLKLPGKRDFDAPARARLAELPPAKRPPTPSKGQGTVHASRGGAGARAASGAASAHESASDVVPDAAGAGAARAKGAPAHAPPPAALALAMAAGLPATEIAQVEVLPDPPPPGTPPRSLLALERQADAGESVVLMRLSDAVGVRRGEIPAEGNHPRRLYFDLSPALVPDAVPAPLEVDDGVIRRVRVGQHHADTIRLVVELAGAEEPALDIHRDPFELRLRVADPTRASRQGHPVAETVGSAGADPAVRAATLPDPGDVRERLGETGAPGGVSMSQQFGLRVRRIVLDAGHGGHDTGAVGPSGLREKDVTLAIAQRVRDRLRERLPDIEVLMTRDDDRFVELSDRTRVANEMGADLFISIHANANPNRQVRGVETYYLNITHDRYSIRLAARENAAHGESAGISDLQYILADLAMKSNVDDSLRLGRQVQRSLVKSLRSKYSSVEDLGLKHALFAVLIGARMPAILVETSFVSNRVEEKRLKTGQYQDALADGIVQGVRKFLEERQAFYAASP